jgi:hypothetical protein
MRDFVCSSVCSSCRRGLGAFALTLSVLVSPAPAQQAAEPHDHSQHAVPPMDHSQHAMPPGDHSQHKMTTPDHSGHQPAAGVEKKAASKKPGKKPDKHSGHPASHSTMHHNSPGKQTAHSGHGGGAHDDHGGMKGFLGPYAMTREGSGTSWVPDTSPHEGIHGKAGEWSTMWHGYLNLIYDHQGGPRGGDKTFTNGMVMGMAQRPLGDGTVGVRAMLSPDPFMGKSGYPLLLASGETADGRTHLIDRQHPHDLFMELAGTYSRNLNATSSVFVYAGLPGEPALGPPAFMHRTSGVDIPEAPITHHWLDSTHITFGVVTAGLIVDKWKMEASAFRGREPDQHRYDIEAPKLDSFSARLSWNPIRELSMQVSWGRLNSPEQLAPAVDEDRVTASAIYTQPFGNDNLWSTTAAWGRKILRPGQTLDGYMLESALMFQKTFTLFMRGERVAETELHEDIAALDGQILMVNKLSVGGIYDFYRTNHVKFGIGGLVSKYALPDVLKPLYGSDPTSGMVFLRLKVI